MYIELINKKNWLVSKTVDAHKLEPLCSSDKSNLQNILEVFSCVEMMNLINFLIEVVHFLNIVHGV